MCVDQYGLNSKEILRLTQNLIRIRTSQPNCNELDMVKFILTLFDGYDVVSNIVHHGENRASLVVTIKGVDSSQKTALVGHIDTIIPSNPQNWFHPPYAADFENGIIYGNGASNSKGGVAAMIYAALFILRNGILLPNDAVFCFTADGDADGKGAMMIYEGGFMQNVSELIFADPTDSKIGIAQKGVLWLELSAKGAFKHVLDAEKSVDPLQRILTISQKLSAELSKMPKHALLGKSTSYLTNINSGINPICVIPEEVHASLDVRYSPLIKESEILEKVTAISKAEMVDFPGLSIEVSKRISRDPIGIPQDAPIVCKMCECFEHLGKSPSKMGLGFYSDSSKLVPSLGAPFVLLGPGNWIFTNREDESVALDSILFVTRIYIDYLSK